MKKRDGGGKDRFKNNAERPRRKPESRERTGSARARYIEENEFTLYGWNACMRAFERRPKDLRRLFFLKERSSALSEVKEWCRRRNLPYRELDPESMCKVADSVHHEGVVMVMRPYKPESVHSLVFRGLPPGGVLVALDGVSNANNLGAVLRNCGFFGASGLLFQPGGAQARITPAAARNAEGALEVVPLYETTDLASALRDLKARGVFIVGTDPAAGVPLFETRLPTPCVVVFGNEREGLSTRVKERCDVLTRIPGAGNGLQSLNIAAAVAVTLAELLRRRAAAPQPATADAAIARAPKR